MALILLGRSRCALCDQVLEQGQALIATSHFVEDQDHDLWRFSDAGMHRACFLAWPLREEFVELFNQVHLRHIRGMLFMHPDGTIERRDPQPRGTAN